MRCKLRAAFILTIFCLLLSSCRHSGQVPDGVRPEPGDLPAEGNQAEIFDELQSADYDANQLRPIDIPLDASILFAQEDYLLYTRWDESSENEQEELLFIYHYDTKENRFLSRIRFPNMYADPAVQIGRCVYFLGGLENQPCGICRLELDTLTVEQIYQMSRNTVYPRLSQWGDQVVILSAADEGETSLYRLEMFDTVQENVRMITEKKYVSGAGEYIVCMEVDGAYIYTFERETDGTDNQCRISRYGPEGGAENYPVDLSELIIVDADGISKDVVVEMEKIGQFFVLSTLNRRLYVLRLTDDGIQKEPIDEKFYQPLRGKYSFLSTMGPEADSLYIQSIRDNTMILRFDGETANFQEIQLPDSPRLIFCGGSYGPWVVAQENLDGYGQRGPFYQMPLPK